MKKEKPTDVGGEVKMGYELLTCLLFLFFVALSTLLWWAGVIGSDDIRTCLAIFGGVVFYHMIIRK